MNTIMTRADWLFGTITTAMTCCPLFRAFIVPVFFLLFVWLFRRIWGRIVAVVFMFAFGYAVYHQHGFTRPTPQVEDSDIHFFAVADNTLSSFFMSRGGYDDFEDDKSETARLRYGDFIYMTNAFAKGIIEGMRKVQTNDHLLAGATVLTNHLGFALSNLSLPDYGTTADLPVKDELALKKYYLFHALCFAFSGALLCMMFARRLMNAVLVFFRARNVWRPFCSFIERQGRSAVFWDAGEESLAAADSLNSPLAGAKRGRPIFAFLENKPFALQRDPTADEDRLDEPKRRYPWIYVGPETLGGRGTSSLLHADEHYFLGPDGQKNVATANHLLEEIQRCKLSFSPKVFIRIDADAEEDVLFKWADGQKDKKAEIILVHEPSQVAASLLREYPLTDTLGVSVKDAHIEPLNKDKDIANDEIAPKETEDLPAVGDTGAAFRVMIVGFGAQGKAILRETIQLGVFPGTRRSIDVTVVDADEKAFEPLWFGLKQVNGDIDNSDSSDPVFPARIIFRANDARSGAFWEFINNRVPEKKEGESAKNMPWNRVVFALPDDLENLRLAKRMERLYRNKNWLCGNPKDGESPVFFAGVRRKANTRYAGSVAQTASDEESRWVATFGDLETLYRNLSSNIEKQDKGAVYLNWTYSSEDNIPPLDAWNQQSFFDKESSRAAVLGMRNLARLLGWRVVDATTPGAVPTDRIRIEASCIDALARVEHLRWCAFHILRGIRPWKPSSDEIKKAIINRRKEIESYEGKPTAFSKPNDRDGHDRHAALVPTGGLEAVDTRFATGTKEAIRHLKEIGMADSDLAKIICPDSVAEVDKLFVLKLERVLGEACWEIERV